jgi:HlyD family secretion protein
MRKAVIWVIVLVFALGLSIGFYFNKSQAIQTSSAALHEFTTFIEGAGTVNAPTQLVLTPSAGMVKKLAVKEGQYLQAGSPILQMDDDVLRLQLEEALLALNAQKKEWIRQNGELTRSEQETAMAAAQAVGYGLEPFNTASLAPEEKKLGAEQVDLARLKVRQANELIDNSTVRAAISGSVLEVAVREGELVPAGQQAAIVAAMDEVEIESVFADQDAANIAPGMEVQLYGGCLGSGTCAGTVTQTAPMAQAQQAQTGPKSVAVVKIKPEAAGLFGRLGASVELKVITGRKTAVGVPIEALAQDSTGLIVYVIRNGRAYRTPVEVGVLDEAFAEVKSGLKPGDIVALNPTELRNGERVSGS